MKTLKIKRISFVFFAILVVGIITGCTQKDDTQISDIQTNNDNQVIQEMEQEKPSWYGKELIIDSNEFEFMSSKEVNLRPSYSDRSEVVGKIKQWNTVIIIWYDSDNDYCKIKKDKLEWWISCAWISNIPNEMSNSWTE